MFKIGDSPYIQGGFVLFFVLVCENTFIDTPRKESKTSPINGGDEPVHDVVV